MNRKGMSQALTIVVAAVVLIVVALVIITIVTGGLGKFGTDQRSQIVDTGEQIATASDLSYCQTQCKMENANAKYKDDAGVSQSCVGGARPLVNANCDAI